MTSHITCPPSSQIAQQTEPVKPGYRWYVMMTESRKEEKLQRQLNMRRFLTFLPLGRYTVAPRGGGTKRRTRTRPLFPGYLFVLFDISRTQWRDLRWLNGAAGFVARADEVPLPVRQGNIETLQAEHNRAGGFVILTPELSKGDSFTVPSGVLAGKQGSVIRRVNRGTELRVDYVVDTRVGRIVSSIPLVAIRAEGISRRSG